MSLWTVCCLAFTAFLVVGLMLVSYPLTAAKRAAKRKRLDEVAKYRMVGASEEIDAPADAAPAESGLTSRGLALVDRAVRARGDHAKLVTTLERTGMRIRPAEWAAIQLAVIVAFAVIPIFLLGSPLGVLGGLAGWAMCRLYLAHKAKSHSAAFEANLPDALALMAGALRSGFTLNQSIGSVVREGTEPTASEFGRAFTEVRLGSELEDALDGMADRLRSLDMSLVVMVIRTSREVGGNLAETIQTAAHTMRERAQLRGQVKVLSAEGRLSARVLTALPILLAVYLLLFKPGYLNPLVETFVGIAMLCTGIVLLVAGTFWLSRLVKIEV
jgi:Flp pilus assembly protein TadB